MVCFLKRKAIGAAKMLSGIWTILACFLFFVAPSGSCHTVAWAEAAPSTFVAEGAVWHYSVMEEYGANEMLHNLSEPLRQFAPLGDGARYLFVRIDTIEFDAAATDPISLWRGLDADRLVFHLGDEEYKYSLAIEYGTNDVFCFALIVPEMMLDDASVTIAFH